MPSCPSCGQEFAGGERFCPTDGAKLPDPDDTPTAREKDPLIGKLIDGRYRVVSKLGEGGMGAVYRATHVHMEKSFALKILRPHLSIDAVAVRRFQREAKSASLLDHEHCIRVTDFGYTPEGLYLAMEHLDGRSLGHEIHDIGALAPPRVVAIGIQIAQALAHAHDQGLIHRDLKPDNVFLIHREGNPDFVKVLDFGLAKLLEKEITEGMPMRTSLTEHGIVFGTPEYMSPEQAEGRPLDTQTDIYSMGICLYHMLTGLLPFQAPTYMSILTKQILEPPVSPVDRRPDLGLPPSVVAVVMQCLAKAPADRPTGARAVAELLAQCDATQQGAPRPAAARVPAAVAAHPTVDVSLPTGGIRFEDTGPPPRRRIAWIVVPLLIVAAAAFATVMAFSKGKSTEPVATPAEPIPVAIAAADAAALPADAATVAAEIAPPDAPLRVASRPPPRESASDHLQKAAVFRKKGDRIQALVQLQQALEVDPDNAEAHLLLGEAALADGNKDLACRHLKRANRTGSKQVNKAKALYEKAECDLVGP